MKQVTISTTTVPMHEAEGFVSSLTAQFADGSTVTRSGPRGGRNATEAETALWNSEETMLWLQGQLDRSVLRKSETVVNPEAAQITEEYGHTLTKMNFRELQALCKDSNINAKGSAEELRERLKAASQT